MQHLKTIAIFKHCVENHNRLLPKNTSFTQSVSRLTAVVPMRMNVMKRPIIIGWQTNLMPSALILASVPVAVSKSSTTTTSEYSTLE